MYRFRASLGQVPASAPSTRLATRFPTGSRLGSSRRTAHDELRHELNVLMLVRQVMIEGVDLFEEQLSRPPAQQLPGLANGRERNRRGSGEDDVVVADDRHVVRDPDAMRDEPLQQADRQKV